MQRVHRDLTVCDVRPRPVHTYVLEASPLRSIASICPGGFARHYNRARGYTFSGATLSGTHTAPMSYPKCDARYRN
jgi:hypothetical protein